ncbi:MAG: murD [Steroidobacteraceae bacterium]|jgi:UDP-N-acetylmuramoylalanine--D-glutamate ligase|nr:murD [Steroidobacteraceae bacterium]
MSDARNSARGTARNAVIVGMGRTGLSVARHLQRCGYGISITDTRESPPELAGVQALGSSVVTRTGGFDPLLLERADIVVTSPGVPLDDPFFTQARARGLDIVGDIELFARAADAPVVGITGTNGKSTVTTLLGRMAERAGVRVRVGGNLGQPALDLLDRGPTDLYVLELSSFQLDTTHSLKLKAAVVLNVSADHLDRYATLRHYADSKARIYAGCETAVVNADEPEVVRMPRAGSRVITFGLQGNADFTLATPASDKAPWLARRGSPLLPLSSLRISGRHNAANALATMALGDALRLPLQPMVDELREFTGLPHRAQWVAERNGVRFINDSKGTNVGATLAAVAGFSGPLVLIAGGDGKGQDFTALANAFRGKVRTTVLLGRDAGLIETALAGVCHTVRVNGMEEAVREAARFARPGDTVLLSPACSSLDMFRDYAHRGSVFAAAVHELPGSPSGEQGTPR